MTYFTDVPKRLLTRCYLVGGAVRDHLLGLSPKDLDYVVVDSTEQEMIGLGFKRVGSSFPVFLHPTTGHEFALARTERKSGEGYSGFVWDTEGVTLEEDLCRRDLTINSMAMDYEGNLIDPFLGQEDLSNHTLQHTSTAFSEDPVRVLRVARFLARYGEDWKLSSETYTVCSGIVESSEWRNLTAERVWKETSRSLTESHPDLYFQLIWELENNPARFRWFSEWMYDDVTFQPEDHHPERSVDRHLLLCLQQAADRGLSAEEVWAVVCHDLGKSIVYNKYGKFHGHEEAGVVAVESVCDRLKVPNSFRSLATTVCKHHTKCHRAFELKPSTLLNLLNDVGAFRNKDRLESFLVCCLCDAKGRGGDFPHRQYPQMDYIKACYEATIEVDCKEIADRCNGNGKLIQQRIHQERVKRVKQEKSKWGN